MCCLFDSQGFSAKFWSFIDFRNKCIKQYNRLYRTDDGYVDSSQKKSKQYPEMTSLSTKLMQSIYWQTRQPILSLQRMVLRHWRAEVGHCAKLKGGHGWMEVGMPPYTPYLLAFSKPHLWGGLFNWDIPAPCRRASGYMWVFALGRAGYKGASVGAEVNKKTARRNNIWFLWTHNPRQMRWFTVQSFMVVWVPEVLTWSQECVKAL